jgi:type IX secretion system PorP/SprF family membrane protein
MKMTNKKTTCMRIKTIVSITTILLCWVCLPKAGAQQIFAISQYMQHNFIYNPAAAGASDNASVGALYRKMWSGIDGGPQTTILYGDTYFEKKRTGLAVFVYDDKTGPTDRTGGQVNLSYSINLGNDKSRRLMFGLGGSFMQYKIDEAYLSQNINDPSDPLLENGSPDSKITGDAAAGIYLKTPTLNVGASVEQIIQSKLGFLKAENNPEGQLYRNYFLMADYNLRTDDEDVLIPNALLMYVPNTPADFQMGVKLMHEDFLWIGLGYHYQQSYTVYAGVKVAHKLELGYAYDQYQTPLSAFDNGSASNELSLRYYFIK